MELNSQIRDLAHSLVKACERPNYITKMIDDQNACQVAFRRFCEQPDITGMLDQMKTCQEAARRFAEQPKLLEEAARRLAEQRENALQAILALSLGKVLD